MARPDHDVAGMEKIGKVGVHHHSAVVRDTGGGKYEKALKPLLHGLSGGDDTDA